MRFDGQVAIVTGAGRGIGKAHAHALAARGAKVVVNDLDTTLAGSENGSFLADQVVDELVDAGGEAIANRADVATREGAESIVESALKAFGKVDIVINNAGILALGDLPSLDVDGLAKHFDVHVAGAFNVTKAAWPHMVERKYGRVIMTSSIGLLGGSSLISYSTAKGGVMSLGRSLAVAGDDVGIKVNLLLPVAETRMVNDEAVRAQSNIPPLGEDGATSPGREPELITPMMLLLAHESCPVSGEMLEAGLGRFSLLFIGETRGIIDPGLGPEGILERWEEIVDETDYLEHASTKDAVIIRENSLAEAKMKSKE